MLQADTFQLLSSAFANNYVFHGFKQIFKDFRHHHPGWWPRQYFGMVTSGGAANAIGAKDFDGCS